MPRCLIGLGANLGDRRGQLERAIESLGEIPETQVVAVSSWHTTEPIGGPAGQEPFLNGAAIIETALDAESLWSHMAACETRLGRQRHRRWDARSVDLDLLLYGDEIWESARLTVPHPWLVARRFVLEPAAEIADSWVHPCVQWTIGRLWQHAQRDLPRFAIVGDPPTEWLEQLAGQTQCRHERLGIDAAECEREFNEEMCERLLHDGRASGWSNRSRERILVSGPGTLAMAWQRVRQRCTAESHAAFAQRWEALMHDYGRAKLLLVVARPDGTLPVEQDCLHAQQAPWVALRNSEPQEWLREAAGAIEAIEGK